MQRIAQHLDVAYMSAHGKYHGNCIFSGPDTIDVEWRSGQRSRNRLHNKLFVTAANALKQSGRVIVSST